MNHISRRPNSLDMFAIAPVLSACLGMQSKGLDGGFYEFTA